MAKQFYYIAYLDLIGTTGFCEDEELYYDNITKFSESVETLSPILGKSGKVGVFSDCVYIESSELKNILDFLSRLRVMLIGDSLFFNAAISYGKLGVEPIKGNCKNIFGVRFTNKDISSIYHKQTSFRGIGIWIDPSLLRQIENVTDYKPISSVFYVKEERNGAIVYHPQRYYDVPLFWDNRYNNMYAIERKRNILSIIIKSLYISHCKSQKYGAYYISLLINILRCCDPNQLEWKQSEKKIEHMPAELCIIYNFLVEGDKNLSNLVGLDALCLAFLDTIYNSQSLTLYDKADITEFFLDSFSCLNRRYKYSLDDTPEEPFTGGNRKVFIDFCNGDLARQFVDKVVY